MGRISFTAEEYIAEQNKVDEVNNKFESKYGAPFRHRVRGICEIFEKAGFAYSDGSLKEFSVSPWDVKATVVGGDKAPGGEILLMYNSGHCKTTYLSLAGEDVFAAEDFFADDWKERIAGRYGAYQAEKAEKFRVQREEQEYAEYLRLKEKYETEGERES